MGAHIYSMDVNYHPMCLNSCTARFARPSPTAVADPECARGGGVSHILAEKRGVSFALFENMHENSIFLPIMGGGYAGYALCWIRHCTAF